MEDLRPILPHRDKVGYVAARNTRILGDTLTEFLNFKMELIRKYGEVDRDEFGNELNTISINTISPAFESFSEEFEPIRNIEHEVDLMTLRYDEIIGLLNGEEILRLDWMLIDE